jgi:hypothetical protein
VKVLCLAEAEGWSVTAAFAAVDQGTAVASAVIAVWQPVHHEE